MFQERLSTLSGRCIKSDKLKLDAHGMRPVRFLGACVCFRDVTSFFCVWYDRGHSGYDLEFFTDRTFIASFSAFCKLIDPFHFFLATMGEGASQVD